MAHIMNWASNNKMTLDLLKTVETSCLSWLASNYIILQC